MHEHLPMGNVSALRNGNTRAILHHVRNNPNTSRADVAKQLGLSAATVSRAIDRVIAEGLIRVVGTGRPRAGRKPALLQFNADRSLVAGVDVGELRIRAAVANLDAEIKACVEEPTLGDVGEYVTVQKAIDAIGRAAREAGATLESLAAVGVAVPGIVDLGRGLVVDAPNIAGWVDFPIKSLLERRFRSPVLVENDTNLAVMGERCVNQLGDVENIVLVSLGAGIGAGVMMGGRLCRGLHGASGEIGFMVVSEKTAQSTKRGLGSLERLVGGPAIVEQARQYLGTEPAPCGSPLAGLCGGDPGRATLDLVFAAAKDGDSGALRIVKDACRYYAAAVANVISTLDPDLVILSGDVTVLGKLVLDEVTGIVGSLVPFVPDIRMSALGRHAVVYGAVFEAARAATEELEAKVQQQA